MAILTVTTIYHAYFQFFNTSPFLCSNWLPVPRDAKWRHPNTILGVVLKECYPGLVTIDGQEVIASTVSHYKATADPRHGNKWEAVKAKFWVSLLF